jgi:hypothetical protein
VRWLLGVSIVAKLTGPVDGRFHSHRSARKGVDWYRARQLASPGKAANQSQGFRVPGAHGVATNLTAGVFRTAMSAIAAGGPNTTRS